MKAVSSQDLLVLVTPSISHLATVWSIDDHQAVLLDKALWNLTERFPVSISRMAQQSSEPPRLGHPADLANELVPSTSLATVPVNDADSSDSMAAWCRTPLSNMPEYSNVKLSVAYQPCLDASRPRMASLLENAWKAKSLKMKRTELISQDAPVRNNAVVLVRAAKQRKKKPCLSRLLSRRLGINVLMTVKIPPKKPFPPPLQWK